jgi:hypothetical protein
VALLPLAAAIVAVATALDLGSSTPWTIARMVADGQIGLAETLAVCLLAGGLAGAVILAARVPVETGGRTQALG